MSRRILLTATLTVLGAWSAAGAQSGSSSKKSWSGSYGLGVAAMPRYSGSDEYRVRPMPLAQLEYKGRLFLGGTQSSEGIALGAYIARSSSFGWSMEFATDGQRREKHADALAGMGNRTISSYVGTTLRYTVGIFTATAGVGTGMGDDIGTQGTASLGATKMIGRWMGSVTGGAAFADRKNMAFDYGIDAAQAVERQTLIDNGDPRLSLADAGTFDPDGGLKDTRLSVSLGYTMTQRTTALFFASGRRLSDEAAKSPIARKRDGGSLGMGIMVGF
jgi:MipA family protein